MRNKYRPLSWSALLVMGLPFIALYAAFFVLAFRRQGLLAAGESRWTLDNFSFLFEPIAWGLGTTSFWKVFANTLVFSIVSATFVTIICLLGGYAISRIEFRGRNFVLALQLALHAVPGEILLIATFFLMLYTGLLNQIVGVALARAALEIPLGLWIAKGFFDDVPKDTERAALADGCTPLGAWWRVLLPMVRPAIVALFIWGMLFAWHDFIYAFTFLQGSNQLLSTMIKNLIATEVVDFGYLAALSLFYTLPPALAFVVLQATMLKSSKSHGKGI